MANDILLGRTVHTPSPKEFRYLRERVAAPQLPGSLQLLAYWQERQQHGGMQMGRDLPCRSLTKLLPNIAVTEPVGEWEDGRIRLAGFAYSERFGRDITGMTIREIYGDDLEGAKAVLAQGRDCTSRQAPAVLHTCVMAGKVELMRFEVLAVPIAAQKSSAIWALAGTFRF